MEIRHNQFEFAEGLGPFEHEGKWGYADADLRIVISPQFDHARKFAEGMAVIQMGKREGYIDRHGRIVIPPIFDRALPFSEGLAQVGYGWDGGWINKWGFIDRGGLPVVPAVYDDATSFHEGMAAVTFGGTMGCGKTGFINREGTLCITPRFDWAGEFCEGLARVESGGRWSYVTKADEVITQFRFHAVTDFKGGLAGVAVTKSRWAIVDTSGRFLTESVFDLVDDMYGPSLRVWQKRRTGTLRADATIEWDENETKPKTIDPLRYLLRLFGRT